MWHIVLCYYGHVRNWPFDQKWTVGGMLKEEMIMTHTVATVECFDQ